MRNSRQGGGEGVGGRAAFQHPSAGAQVHRDWRGGIHNRCGSTGGAHHKVLKVAATGRGDGGLQGAGVLVDVFAICACHNQGAGGLTVRDGDRAFVRHHRGVAMRNSRQGGGEGVGGRAAFQHTGAGAQIDCDRVDRVNNGGGCAAIANVDLLKVAAAGRGNGGMQSAGVLVDVFAVGACDHQGAAGLAVMDHDRALVRHHRGVAV